MKTYSASLVLAMILFACHPLPERNSRITPVDLKSKKLEYVRSNLESVLGSDSAGQSALEYIKDYERELSDNYPDYSRYKTLPVENLDPSSVNEQLSNRNPNSLYLPTPVPTDEINAHNRFMAFLKGKLIDAEVLLNKCSDDYTLTNNLDHAKLGVAAGYVAIASNPWDARLQLIVDKTCLFLDSLYANTSSQRIENIP